MAYPRRRRAGRTEGDEGPRTYGPWGLVWVFVGLAGIGLFVLLFIRPTEDESVKVPTSQTLPEGYEDPTAATEPGEGAAPTLPGGAPAPEGVSSVSVADGTTSLVFDPPSGATTDTGELAPGWSAQIAPAQVSASEDGSEVVVRVGCGRSAEEFLAQLAVTESEIAVTAAPVAVARDGGAPCPEGTGDRHVLTIPLSAPVGERELVTLPAGTPVDGSQTTS